MSDGNSVEPVLVFEIRNNVNLPSGKLEDLTKKGVGIVDFTQDETMTSERAGDKERSAATTSFETLRKLSREGGIGVVHTEGFETVVVGRVSEACVFFPEYENEDGDVQSYKGFKFEEYAEIKKRGLFGDVYTALGNRGQLPTMNPMPYYGDEDAPKREAVMEAYLALEARRTLKKRD
jgi:hypothetical protein